MQKIEWHPSIEEEMGVYLKSYYNGDNVCVCKTTSPPISQFP